MRPARSLLTVVTVAVGSTIASAPARADVVRAIADLMEADALCDQQSELFANDLAELEALARDTGGDAGRTMAEAAARVKEIASEAAPACAAVKADRAWFAEHPLAFRCDVKPDHDPGCPAMIEETRPRVARAAPALAAAKQRKQRVLDALAPVEAVLDELARATPDEVTEASPAEDAPAPAGGDAGPPATPTPAPTQVATAAPPPAPTADVPSVTTPAPARTSSPGRSLGELLAPIRPHVVALGLGRASGVLPEQETWAAAATIARLPWQAEPDFGLGYELRGAVAPSWAHGSARLEVGLAWLGCVCAVVGVEGAGGDGGPAVPAGAIVGGKLGVLLPVGEATGLDLTGAMVWRTGDGSGARDAGIRILLGLDDDEPVWALGFAYSSLAELGSVWTLTLARVQVSLDD